MIQMAEEQKKKAVKYQTTHKKIQKTVYEMYL